MTKGKKYTHQTTKMKEQSKKCNLQEEEEEDTEMQISTIKTAPPIEMTENGKYNYKDQKGYSLFHPICGDN